MDNVQIAFICRLIHVHNRSIAAILFSDTGFTRIRYRRLVLAFQYFVRLLSEHQSPSKVAPCAIDACRALLTLDKRNWLGNIPYSALQRWSQCGKTRSSIQ
ncbi:hypothetical protein DFS33DRAFT_1345302 [Desarmillaria ectypa]|nr:hypothetical protein DFS33DRAFT_1345302 [Desarmillaria ectypa]